jgi:ribosomal protein S18 acetylase RimI-like enzyme
MPLVDWPNQLLPQLGFKRVIDVVTLIKRDLEVPFHIRASEPVEIREVREDDLTTLERIEAAAFTPIWRYGAAGLNLARRQALSFDVALLEDKLVGYQVSTLSTYGAHLARMTVDPAVQRQGVGTTLMLSAIQSYRRANVLNATLNTQMNNVASQRLYARFGYQMTTESVPVWVLAIN